MKTLARQWGGKAWIWASLLGLGAVVAGASVFYSATQKTSSATVDTSSDATATAQNPVQPPPVAETTPAPAVAPSVDVLRVEPDGSALIAGQAPAGAEVVIAVDNEPIASARADASGAFASFIDLPASEAPRVLQLFANDIQSTDDVILGPSRPGTAAPSDAEVALQADTQSAQSEPASQATSSRAEPSRSVPVLRADASGVELITPAPIPTEAPRQVQLDTISYSARGKLNLSGRGQSDTEVQLYLNNQPLTRLPIDPEGRWRTELPDVDVGVHRLRIDQVNASGQVTSRLETPLQREDPELLRSALAQTEASENQVRAITVQEGNSLWAIARETYGDGFLFVRVFEANRAHIRNPDLIYPGQVFVLPE